ncbi:heavy metal translocating P-type ATPase [Carnobacterium maltaromaticum]|uniref:heavy metal translocating P-type ATPase n=1 Tax=Carnobacterium maltaromaticum TaxID=2751 RepID=UPI000C75BBF9|nr:heavy metal translocating P-type ATPase [Carnobacterium maltaromaticum]PLS34241.1 heavy metal translocating P-type ATPase [Carnobacterium maltaromaticum]PLS41705.1 heavy metal translocating P-type ATPase [Carnobacterium maltaromaticum]PLS44097.1 heavy metal translocating P-type ATPase [Carnobacterium maltaromaticum]PLS52167.1 heavy metal translocating P-type ATPase [Carnobacterium maltaromaticum]PLS53361.1 heavy metal translocating P-type ATPase [Carnobacterium maltaromaticum]
MEASKEKVHNHKHDHEHGGGHNHSHGDSKSAVILFFAGLTAFIVALFLTDSSLLQTILFISAMLLSGYHIMLEGITDTIEATKRKRKFSPNVHILMTVAAIGATIIGNYEEGALLIIIFAAAHFMEEYAEGRSKREITNLLKMNPTEARLIEADGSVKVVDVSVLKIGDKLQVLNGDQIATDGVILSGVTSIDESSINGESIPREKTVGDEVFGSTINGNGTFTMEVTKDNSDTLFAKILQLVNQSQSNLSKTATKIQKIEPYYVTAVLIIVPIFILLGPSIFSWTWNESFYRGMVFLISASPCALAASAVPATLSGISNLAKRGVLFKGGSYLANLAGIKAVAFDKTGTLTKGKPSVTDFYFDEIDEATTEQNYIDLIVAMEKTANHPLANAILGKFEAKESIELEVENEIGKGLVAHYNGAVYQIGKPSVFKNVSSKIENHNEQYSKDGKTVVYFAKDNQVIGLIAMMDVPNANAIEVISYLKSQNIHTTMITGDSEMTGQAVGRQLGIDEVIGNVLPENKAQVIKDQQDRYGTVAMLGDGVNDAPALVTADIGVAMGDGTDIAIDVADAVLMQNDLTKFSYAHKVSKRLDRVVWQNIIFSMLIVAILVTLNVLGKMDITIGVIAHEGSTLIVILNGLRLLLPSK